MFGIFKKKDVNPLDKRNERIIVAFPNIINYINVLSTIHNDIDNSGNFTKGFSEVYIYEFLTDSNGYVIDDPIKMVNEFNRLTHKINKQLHLRKDSRTNIVEYTYKKLIIDNALLVSKLLTT